MMKKSLVALAALAVSSAAMAQATMYGVVDIGYGGWSNASRDGSVFTKSGGISDGRNAGNRIGFRGTEDLGGGMKANFLFEQGISPTNPAGFNARVNNYDHQLEGRTGYTTNNNRQSYIGLEGGFGEIRAGWQYKNSYELVAFRGYSAWETQGSNYQNSAGGESGNQVTHAGGSSRFVGLTYTLPKFINAQTTVKIQYGGQNSRETMESSGALSNGLSKSNAAYTGIMAAYDSGPLSLAFTYGKMDLATAAAAANTSAATTSIFGVVTAAPGAADQLNAATRNGVSTHFGGSYDFGMVKASLVYTKYDNGGTAATTNNSITETNQMALYVPVTPATQFIFTSGKGSTATNGAAALAWDSKGTSFGLKHAMSKRTNLYAVTGTEKNEAVAAAATADYERTMWMIGAHHSF